ncbi:MAG: hypothetical protein KBD03_03090, partial [Gammaproteobacteria bacterium]|nr:hypothetical protein [Gammaproteobacteria bacterium]
VFETTFRFKLKHHATNAELLRKTFPTLLALIQSWGQHDLPSAKKGLRLFNGYLAEKKSSLSKDIFYTTAIEQINGLLLQFEKNQSLSLMTPQALPDMTRLIEETRKRFSGLLTIGQDLNTSSVIALQKRISEEALVILNSFLSAIENTLGPAPCAFSILGLGSYSRGEMGLCSDIDFAILVSDESSVQHPYFKSFLSLLVHLRRGLPANVLTIESKDLQTLFGQEKSLMHTPEEMVSEHCPLYTGTEIKSQKDRLTNTESYSVRRARLIFNSQTQPQESKALYEDYQRLLTKQLQTLDSVSSIPYYQMVGQVCLEEDFKKHDGAGLMATTETTTAINLKKTHLRPLTLWLLNVATYFGIAENNSWAILDALNQQSRIAPVFLQELGEALTTLHRLRLKLHHAWLTQPRSAELPFDAWLEMPTNDNTSPPTRDFYLDATQRETLDAIQRRIIEPLTETISVFGATLPPLQFDPVVHYFETQFKALNQKHIVESHCKILPALAEIALRHPSLLRPSLTFRDLLPQIKIGYLDALEVALQAMERPGSTKEIAELKALVKTLWHYPTEDGWRAESIRLEREWNQRLMRLVIAKALSGTSNTLSLVQDNGLKHYTLKPKIASQLLTEQGEWRLKDEKVSGNHLVYRIMDKGTTETLCWAKVYPEQPGIEWLMLQLDQRLGIYGIPASTLINIHHNGRNSAVLLSADVPHPNLLETIKNAPQTLNNLNRAHFFKTLIVSET